MWIGTGSNNATPNYYFDGYMAEVNFVGGQALPPTAFGAINKENGVWAPITYTGTYGLNGFRLTFNNTTSTTTLGYDSSGNGNNWTTNNISLTAGSTYDSMIDSPSKFPGSSYGVGNYAVLNAASVGADCTLSGGNLGMAYGSSGTRNATMATIGMPSGKWYAEFSYTGGSTPEPIVGISSKASSTDMPNYPGYNAYGWGYYIDGTKYNNGSSSAYGATWTTNDVIGIAFDADAGSLTFYKNGASQGVAFTGLTSSPYYFAIGDGAATSTFTGWFNFGQRPFAYTPPTGFKSLCTQNLPNVSIYNGANYMAATTYTGNGSTNTVTNTVNGISFAPGLVWNKNRTNAASHELYDTVRGATNRLCSNLTQAEDVISGVTAFNSNGYALGSGTGSNNNGDSFVGWQWKAGGTAVTNTAGSITSQVSANTTAGFSVATFTTPSSFTNATVGHGLGATPSFIITKPRNVSGGWPVWHTSIGLNNFLSLSTTAASVSSSQSFVGVSSTTFTMGSSSWWQSGVTDFVAYCFAAIAGYSAFGSYTGNGSTDGPFVYCGFRPRYVLIKRTDDVGYWAIGDSARNPYNVTGLELFTNVSDAEANDSPVYDFLSNGFKLRCTYASRNASGGTYIYAAFAENPFQNALAR